MNKNRVLVNLYKDIVLVTRARMFCTALFTNNNIKVVIQIDAFLAHLFSISLTMRKTKVYRMREKVYYITITSVFNLLIRYDS